MWGLFTRALTLASSTVRVSVINTSANFMITAVLGALIFSENLPGLWWLGAAFLVAGSVIIGRREEGVKSETEATITGSHEPLLERDGVDGTGFQDEDDDTHEEVELLSVKSSDEEIESQSEDDDGTLK